MKTEGFLQDWLSFFRYSPLLVLGGSLEHYAGEGQGWHGDFGPFRELARRLGCTFVIMRQQSHTTRQHSYGTGGFCHDIDYLPLEIPTRSQRACRAQIVIHITQCVFETRRSESRPASACIDSGEQSFSIHIRPIHPCEDDGCSFFPAADGFNPERFALT